ncbi:MAG: L-type lectin-domain containing protein [Casimicrobiaceae bacterium]
MKTLLRGWVVGLLFFWSVPVYSATIFNFANFNNCSTLQLNGNAACTGGVLRVTPAAFSQSGSTFSTTLIPLGAGASFSTYFSFRMSASGFGGADGIVFVIQPVASTVGGGGGGIGYVGIPNSLGVEFDTWDNGVGSGDPDGNHVGIDLNGSVASVQTAPVSSPLDDGSIWYAWIDYDGSVLELRLSQTNVRPVSPILSRAVALSSVLGTSSAYVGFTSGTGAAYSNHDILTWRFDNSFAPIGGAAPPPTLSAAPIPTLSDLALGLLALLIAGCAVYRLRRPTELENN